MAKKTEVTLEDKLRALYDLQLIDSRVDEIRNVRGELPLEVEDLENEIAGLESRLQSLQQEVSDFDFQTKEQKNKIEVAKEEHKKYEQNLKNVRNMFNIFFNYAPCNIHKYIHLMYKIRFTFL